MGSFVVGWLLTAGFFLLAILCESTSMALLGMSLALFLGYSFLILTVMGKRVNAILEVPLSVAEKDRKFSVRVNLHNHSKKKFGKVCICIGYRNVMEQAERRRIVTASWVPDGTSHYQYDLMICEPGCYEFAVRELRIYDSLGIFYRKYRMHSSANAMVLPEIHEFPVRIGERVRHFYGDAECFDELRPGYDPGEIFDVREFRNGDKLPGILWKLSAKSGELMVRENSLPKACPVELFLYSYGTGEKGMLERITAAAFSLMDAGCPFYGVWLSSSQKDILRTRVDDEESFYFFLTAYMQDCSREDTADLEERYREKYRGEKGVHTLVFRDGKMYRDGQEFKESLSEERLLELE